MAIDYAALQAELIAGHPVTGPYSADAVLAADEINALNITGPVDGVTILQYFIETQHRENTGTDTQNTNLYGRLEMVAQAAEGSNPLGVAPADSLTVGQIAAAKTVLRMLQGDTFPVNLSNTDVGGALTKCQGANVYSIEQKNAIVALSDGRQSRTQELELGVSRVTESHIRTARGEI